MSYVSRRKVLDLYEEWKKATAAERFTLGRAFLYDWAGLSNETRGYLAALNRWFEDDVKPMALAEERAKHPDSFEDNPTEPDAERIKKLLNEVARLNSELAATFG